MPTEIDLILVGKRPWNGIDGCSIFNAQIGLRLGGISSRILHAYGGFILKAFDDPMLLTGRENPSPSTEHMPCSSERKKTKRCIIILYIDLSVDALGY